MNDISYEVPATIIDIPYKFNCSFPSSHYGENHPYFENDEWQEIRKLIIERRNFINENNGKELLFEILPENRFDFYNHPKKFNIYFSDINGNLYGDYNDGDGLFMLTPKEILNMIDFETFIDYREYY
jgi:hypothetical protein